MSLGHAFVQRHFGRPGQPATSAAALAVSAATCHHRLLLGFAARNCFWRSQCSLFHPKGGTVERLHSPHLAKFYQLAEPLGEPSVSCQRASPSVRSNRGRKRAL